MSAPAGGPLEVERCGVLQAATLGRMLHDFDTEFGLDPDPPEAVAARFARVLPDPAVVALLASDGSRETGFALFTLRPSVYFDAPVGVLDELYVVPSHRGGGIGGALLTTGVRLLRERGCPELHINVDEVDVDARRFYERHGFVNVEKEADGRMLCYVGPIADGP